MRSHRRTLGLHSRALWVSNRGSCGAGELLCPSIGAVPVARFRLQEKRDFPIKVRRRFLWETISDHVSDARVPRPLFGSSGVLLRVEKLLHPGGTEYLQRFQRGKGGIHIWNRQYRSQATGFIESFVRHLDACRHG